MSDIGMYAKAIVGALVAAASYAVPVVDRGLNPSDWLGIGIAFLVALGVVWAVPNAPPKVPGGGPVEHAGE